MKVYLVCETVDLGYHVVAGYLSENRARVEMEKLNEEAFQQKVQDLMEIGYNKENAEKYARQLHYYELAELAEVEVEE